MKPVKPTQSSQRYLNMLKAPRQKIASGALLYFLAAGQRAASRPPRCVFGRPRPPSCRYGCWKTPTILWVIWPKLFRFYCRLHSTNQRETLQQWIQALLNLKGQDLAARKGFMLAAWTECDGYERFVFNKLITGGFRIGVSQKLMTRALAQATGQDAADLAHKLMGQWNPQMTSWDDLILAQNASINLSRPYPFCLAHALDTEPTKLGDISEWSAEWKWDGIRAQVVVREKNCFIWSRGEEMVNNQFPELAPLAEQLPHGTVIDGELLAWADDKPLPFHLLQKRLGRKTVPASMLKSAPNTAGSL